MVDRVPEELWMEDNNTLEEEITKTIPKKKKCNKAKWLSEEGLQRAEERREAKGKGGKGEIYPSKRRVLKNSKER